MKNKFLILFIGIISFLCISEVKAEIYNVTFSDNFSSEIERDSSIIEEQYNDVYSYYVEKYKSSYPYYFVNISYGGASIYFDFYAFDNPIQISNFTSSPSSFTLVNSDFSALSNYLHIRAFYDSESHSHYRPFSIDTLTSDSIFGFSTSATYFVAQVFYTNYDMKFISYNGVDKISTSFNGDSLTINSGDSFPLGQDLFDLNIISDPNLSSNNYTEINLNNYPYVVLSLNDYSISDDFYSNMYVKGQYCVTPGYNYGLLSYDDVNSTRVQNICSQYYDQETLVRMYVTKDNLKNNAIYYIKAQDKTKDNIIKVDTSIFTIHYIYEDDKDNPIININGKNYSIIPFDELPSTANGNTDEGFVPGLSCQVGDFNCTTSNYYRSDSNLFDENGNLSFGSIFSSPLDLLKDIWSAIIKVFELISMLILLLPTPLQSFLFLSFMLAIILGIIKILL